MEKKKKFKGILNTFLSTS